MAARPSPSPALAFCQPLSLSPFVRVWLPLAPERKHLRGPRPLPPPLLPPAFPCGSEGSAGSRAPRGCVTAAPQTRWTPPRKVRRRLPRPCSGARARVGPRRSRRLPGAVCSPGRRARGSCGPSSGLRSEGDPLRAPRRFPRATTQPRLGHWSAGTSVSVTWGAEPWGVRDVGCRDVRCPRHGGARRLGCRRP